MGREVNPDVKPGERIVCVYMKDLYSPVPVGTGGTVKRVGRDPFEEDEKIIEVEWDNGSSLALVSAEDIWMRESDIYPEKQSRINEDSAPSMDTLYEMKDVFKHMKEKVFFDFLVEIKNSGLVNMFGSVQFLMSGPEYLKKFIEMEGRKINKDKVNKLLDLSKKTKNEIIQATFKIMEERGIEDYSTENINKIARELSKNVLLYYITMFSHTS